MKLSDAEIIKRVRIGKSALKRFRASDRDASDRYIDARALGPGYDRDDGENLEIFVTEIEVPDMIPVGQVNPMTVNNETKMAAIAMSVPTLQIHANEDPKDEQNGVPGAPKIVSAAWEDLWLTYDLDRVAQAALQKCGICGVGVIWYRWDSKRGPAFAHVPSDRWFVDPHADNMADIEWAGVTVKLSLRQAMAMYPEKKEIFTSEATLPTDDQNSDNQVRVVDIYFDEDEEVHVRGEEVLFRDKNLYGKIPLLFLQSFIDPRDRLLPLGDNVFASGLSDQVTQLNQVIADIAKHGGQITVASNRFEDQEKTAIKDGLTQQVLFTDVPLNVPPIIRISAEQPSPAWGPATQAAQAALDAIQGVTSGARGIMQENVSATQAAMILSRAGAKPTQLRYQYEAFMTKMARTFVKLVQDFGGAEEENEGDATVLRVWKAFKAVYNVKVIPGSTSFNDPARDQQAAMQLYREVVQSLQAWMMLAARGMVERVPNLEECFNDLLRAFARPDTDRYWRPVPPPPPPAQTLSPQLARAFTALYKEANPDVRRQIEQDLGLKPSQMEEQQEPQSPQAPDHAQEEMLTKAHLQQNQHEHETRLELLKIAAQVQREEQTSKVPKPKDS